MEIDYNKIIVWQAQKIVELEDKLSESAKSSNYWYDEFQRLKVIPAPKGEDNA